MSTENLTEYLRVFRVVVDRESFSAASRVLNMSPAWVAARVTQLEEYLNETLLIRSTRQLSLTEAGQKCYHAAGRVADELEYLRETLHVEASSISGRVRLNVPTVFAQARLGRMLREFQTRYPNLTLDLTVSDRFVDVQNDDTDILIRIAHALQDSNLIVRKIGSMRRVLCASPDYLIGAPRLSRLSDIQHHSALLYSGLMSSDQWYLSDHKNSAWCDPNPTVRANNSYLLKTAAIDGAGIAFLPELIVEDELKSGALVQISTLFDPTPFGIYLLRANVKRLPKKLQIVWDFLVEKSESTIVLR